MPRCSQLTVGGAKVAGALRAYALIAGEVVPVRHADDLADVAGTVPV